MSSPMTQTSQHGLALTAEILRPVNSLTRASPKPGFLDYSTYLKLLVRDGHVQNSHPASNSQAPARPLKSSLQIVHTQDRSDRKTDFRAEQALWSQANLPDVLYHLRPPPNWINEKYLKEPPLKTYPIHGKILRDIPILPDHIAHKLEGWRLQAWYCFYPLVRLGDILARINNTVNGSTVQMRSLRFRADCPALGWANKGPKYDAEKLRIEGLMQDTRLDPAGPTTRDLAWGLVDPDDENSDRIEIPAKRGWDCSVEEATAAHLNPIQSPVASGLPRFAPPAPLLAATASSHRRVLQPADAESDDTISNGDGDDTEDDVDVLDFETETRPTPRTGAKRKLSEPHESASKRQNTSSRVFEGPFSILAPASDGEPQVASHNDGRHYLFEEDLSPLGYPPPAEVPRAPSIAYPLGYQPWLADDLQNAGNLQRHNGNEEIDDQGVFPGVVHFLKDSGVVRTFVQYGDRWLGLKTRQERQHFSNEARQMLDSFFPAGSEGRLRQLEYLLDPECAQFGLEHRNGQWGATNWDWNNTSNVHYTGSHTEASALLARHQERQQDQRMQYDNSAYLPIDPLLLGT